MLIIIGIIIPFVPSIVVIEMFFLLIPLGLIFLGTLTYLLICVYNKNKNTKNAVFAFSIVPTFILTQFLAGQAVDKIQKYRSQTIIVELNKLKEQTGEYPESFSIPLGINYKRLTKGEGFKLEFSRGFMVTEKFYSETEIWESVGWND